MTDSSADVSFSDPSFDNKGETPAPSSTARVVANPASIVFAALDAKDLKRALKEVQNLTDDEIVSARSSASFGLQHAAALKGAVELMKYVAAHGADVNALFPGGHWTPLLLASSRAPMVDTLLELGADPNLCAPNGLSPLTAALSQNNLQSARALVKAGAQPDGPSHASWPPLFSAAGFATDAALEYLKELGANLAFRSPTGRSALHQAASHGAADSVLFLANNGVGLEWTDRDGNTALHQAASHNNVQTVAALLKLGAHPAKENHEGKVPSELASDADGIVTLLREAEASTPRVLNAAAPKKKSAKVENPEPVAKKVKTAAPKTPPKPAAAKKGTKSTAPKAKAAVVKPGKVAQSVAIESPAAKPARRKPKM